MSNGLDPDQDLHVVGPYLVQTVCKGNEQTTKVAARKESVKGSFRLVKYLNYESFLVKSLRISICLESAGISIGLKKVLSYASFCKT